MCADEKMSLANVKKAAAAAVVASQSQPLPPEPSSSLANGQQRRSSSLNGNEIGEGGQGICRNRRRRHPPNPSIVAISQCSVDQIDEDLLLQQPSTSSATMLISPISATAAAVNLANVPPKNVPFECSHKLDMNSLQALQHDDDEDQVHQANSSYLNKQKQNRQDGGTKNGVGPGGTIGVSANANNNNNFRLYGELCAVCGDLASGVHFSVWSCNGCKTFFRRVVIENRTYSCKRDGNCPMDKDHRCSCRACRFKKCLKVGMDSAELNIERRRKRKVTEIIRPAIIIDRIDDPLIRELVGKERQFTKLLTSTITPIHPSIRDALKQEASCFEQFEQHERNQMRPGDQMNFSYWRAKILSSTIEWAKSFEEFGQLCQEDKEAMIVHSCFSILVFSEAFHTPERYTDRIVFPDGLSGFRNLSANIIRERSGLIPTVVAVINNILVPIRRMQMTEIEYVLLCAILLFDPECLTLTESAIQIITEKRSAVLFSLRRHLDFKLKDPLEAAIRMADLLLRISNVHKVAAFKRETLCTIETFNLMSPHPLTMEISKKYADVSFF